MRPTPRSIAAVLLLVFSAGAWLVAEAHGGEYGNDAGIEANKALKDP